MTKAIDYLAYLIVRLFVAVIQAMPLSMGDEICRGIAKIATGPLKIRRRTTEENLCRVFPDASETDRRRLELAMWHHLLLMVCEIAWAQRRLHRCNWRKHVTFNGNRDVLLRMLSDRPAVVVSGHFGNFEIGGYVTGLMGLSSTAIARKLDNSYLHDWVKNFRSANHQFMVDKEGCAPHVDRHLKNGGSLSILADQHAGPKGCWVNFCGVPASSHKALALFSLTGNAPMLAGHTRRVNGQPMQFETTCMAVCDPADRDDPNGQSVTAMTEWYNRCLESSIRVAPEQYWWLHRRWRTPPEKVAKRLSRRAEAKGAKSLSSELSASDKQAA